MTNRATRNDVATGVNGVAATQPFDNAVRPANGVTRCPHCQHELAVIAVVIPADAAHVLTPEMP